MGSRWITVSDSPHDHEREALAWLRSRLPDREPYHVWANFEFTTHNGQLYEIDALAITDNGVHLIEIKGYPGQIDGDGGTWEWTAPDGRFRQLDNPRLLANRKAKALKSLIESSPAFKKHRSDVPYIAESVFLSDPKLRSGLNPQGRFQVFGRDSANNEPLPPERAALGGIVDNLVSLDPDESGRARKRIQRSVVDRLVKAIDQLGIRERSSRREIGDYRVGRLLNDVEADATTGVAYQDFEGKHRSLDLTRRLRLYPLELNATSGQREAAQRAARREFELLDRLDHPGIVRPLDYTDHERGPVLVFDYDPDEVSLPTYFADPANSAMSVEDRLVIIRQIAEAVAFANGRGVYHRSLSPSAILVRPPTSTDHLPRVRVTNWHTGARIAEGGTSTIVTGTVHAHVEALAASDSELYRAPEFLQPEARPALLDVFSLGSLSLFVLTGERPAANVRQLRAVLSFVGYLDPSSVADAIDPVLADVVIFATTADPAGRPPSVDDFITYLDLAEEQWHLEQLDGAEEEVHPLEARRGDKLAADRFEVVQRLGQGSTALALLVKDTQRYDQLCVMKIAEKPEHNERIIDEASALDGLTHANVVSLLEEPFDVSGHTAILISYAGPRIDPDKTDLGQGRTLASRLSGGPVGAELAQRWGEDLLDALKYLEQMGRAHRDIKPENLGVAPRGDSELHLVLFDFSLSSAPLDRIEAGTPGYIDPFLEQRKRWDPAADRYAATVTLYQLTTGTRPRYGDGTADPAMVRAAPTIDSSLFDSAAAPGLTVFFTKALQPDVADRFGTAEDMYWAWHEAFSAAALPATPSTHPDGDDDFTIPDSTTLDSPLAGLPLSQRGVSALERADVITVRQLLAFPLMQLRSLKGVGAKTRGELREALDLLQAHFPDVEPPTDEEPVADTDREQPSDAPTNWLESAADTAAPPARTSDLATRASLARILTGLEPGKNPWASQSELAAWLGVTPGRISQLITALRKSWAKQPQITRIRETVNADLTQLQVASAQQLAARLMAQTPDGVVGERGADLALGLVRIAALTEELMTSPGWIVRRRHGAVLLAIQPEADEDSAEFAQSLADYASALAVETGKLIADHDVVSRRELLDQLRRVPQPAGAAPLADAHVADLGADLCEDAAVNSRLELYRVNLPPVAALRAARRAFVSAGEFTTTDIAAKISARFPQAAPMPDRPALDGVLADAGVELVWHDAKHAYVNPQYEPSGSTSYQSSISRYPTSLPTPVPTVEIDNAADFEQRLVAARDSGGLLVLVTEAKELDNARHQLTRLATTTIDVDELLVRQLEAITETGKPSWDTLATADASGEGSPAWGRLRQVIDRALDGLTEQIAATTGTVLLVNPGLLARYDRLDLVARWRDLLHAGNSSMSAVWLLMPSSAASDVPLLDGRAVPVISRNEWSQIPADWLRNAHRAGAG